MPVQINSTFKERLQNIDKTDAIELYYKLLSSGHSVGAILGALNSIQSTAEHGDAATAEQPRIKFDKAPTDIASVQGRQANIQHTPDTSTSLTSNEGRTEPAQAAESAPLNGQEADNRGQIPDNLSGSEPDIPATADPQTETNCDPTLCPGDQEPIRPGKSRGIGRRVAFGTLYAAAVTSAVAVSFSIVPIIRDAQLTSARVPSSISGGIRTGAIPRAEAGRAKAVENLTNLKKQAVDADLLRAPEPCDPPNRIRQFPARRIGPQRKSVPRLPPPRRKPRNPTVRKSTNRMQLASRPALRHSIAQCATQRPPRPRRKRQKPLTTRPQPAYTRPARRQPQHQRPQQRKPQVRIRRSTTCASATSAGAEHRIEGDRGGMPAADPAEIARAEQPDAARPPAHEAAAPAPVPRIAEIAPEDPRFKTMAADALVTRGDTFFAAGDLASARLFYEHAVAAGNAVAALRLGGTFDPGFLARAGIGRVQGDAAIALYWYRRARDLGNSDAEILLKKMEKLAQ